jgi:Uma2 family endonuclease
MNEVLRPPDLSMTTDAAEGLMRRRWTVAEIEAMVEAGILGEDERLELIGGEVVPMSPKGIRHEVVKAELLDHWYRKLPADLRISVETTFRLSNDTFVEPDLVFYRKADSIRSLSPQTALLAVEVADSSIVYDLERKARVCAMSGLRCLWVVDARTLATHVHRLPRPDGYGDVAVVAADIALVPDFATDLTVTLSTLDLR